ncbi:hypothetical protein [Streptomyces sp. NBC_00859]|uniref:hypothetical protein n=1 Tax=Streptomyces sp. NBC_00859 TaxID=2903682 RepID=UPI00386C506C|nr:hypothetical protein OG584_19415 [Streptomyces sp. NBC_00859]
MRLPDALVRAYFGGLGVAEIQIVSAEVPLAGSVPHLARFRPPAASSLDAARAGVTALASGQVGAGGRVDRIGCRTG